MKLDHAATVAGLFAAASMPVYADVTYLLDDFAKGNDDLWEHVDQTIDACENPASYDASSGAYVISSDCAMDDENDEILAARWVGTNSGFADGRVRLTAQHMTAQTNLWVNMRSWGSVNTGIVGYRFRISAGGTQLSISRMWEHASEIELAAKTTLDLVFFPGEQINIETEAVGDRLSLKVWAVGEPEPDHPQLTANDNIYQNGDLVIGMNHEIGEGPLGATYDDIFYTEIRPADINGDGVVDTADLLEVILAWGNCESCPADTNGDGSVDFEDLSNVLSNWG